MKVDGKLTCCGPVGCRYAKVARACASVILPSSVQIWLTIVVGLIVGFRRHRRIFHRHQRLAALRIALEDLHCLGEHGWRPCAAAPAFP